MQRFLGSWNMGRKIKEILDLPDKTIDGRSSRKREEEIQRAKNYKRFKEDVEDADKADKKIRETGF